MTQMRSRLLRLEEASILRKPAGERTNWLCARVPADTPQSRLDALRREAAKLGGQFSGYTYDGPPDYPGHQLPELYVLHPIEQMPATYACEFVRKARNAQCS